MTARYTVINPDGTEGEPNENCLHCRISVVVQDHAYEHEMTHEDVAAAMFQCLVEVIASAETGEERAHLTQEVLHSLPDAVREARETHARHEKRRMS